MQEATERGGHARTRDEVYYFERWDGFVVGEFVEYRQAPNAVIVRKGRVGTPGTTTYLRGQRLRDIDFRMLCIRERFTRVPSPTRHHTPARDAELEALLQTDPTDEVMSVYTDWLLERGDPRGTALLQQRRQPKPWDDMRHAYGPMWCGGHSRRFSYGTFRSHRAFISSVFFDFRVIPASNDWSHERAFHEVLNHPACLFLRRLKMDGAHDWRPYVHELLEANPIHLKTLELGGRPRSGPPVECLGTVIDALPELHQIEVKTSRCTLGVARAPELRELTLSAAEVGASFFEDLLHSELPRLTHLSVFAEEAPLAPRELADCPLETLNLKGMTGFDDLASALVRSPAADTLQSLALIQGDLTETGVADLIAAFAHRSDPPRIVNVRGNGLSADTESRLNWVQPRPRGYR